MCFVMKSSFRFLRVNRVLQPSTRSLICSRPFRLSCFFPKVSRSEQPAVDQQTTGENKYFAPAFSRAFVPLPPILGGENSIGRPSWCCSRRSAWPPKSSSTTTGRTTSSTRIGLVSPFFFFPLGGAGGGGVAGRKHFFCLGGGGVVVGRKHAANNIQCHKPQVYPSSATALQISASSGFQLKRR